MGSSFWRGWSSLKVLQVLTELRFHSLYSNVMPNTYHALLKGDRLEWQGEMPEAKEGTVAVRVTLLEDEAFIAEDGGGPRGERMAAVLERLAGLDPFADENDLAQWEKEQRQERDLPRPS